MKWGAFRRGAWARAVVFSGLPVVQRAALLGLLARCNENGSGLFVPREIAGELRLAPATFCRAVEQLAAAGVVACSPIVSLKAGGPIAYFYHLPERPPATWKRSATGGRHV